MTLDEILRKSAFKVADGVYSVAKLGTGAPPQDGCFMVACDELETTVIYEQAMEMEGVVDERPGYRIIAVDVALPFQAPGFIAAVTGAIAGCGAAVLVVSTFSRDCFLVQEADLPAAVAALAGLGMPEA